MGCVYVTRQSAYDESNMTLANLRHIPSEEDLLEIDYARRRIRNQRLQRTMPGSRIRRTLHRYYRIHRGASNGFGFFLIRDWRCVAHRIGVLAGSFQDGCERYQGVRRKEGILLVET